MGLPNAVFPGLSTATQSTPPANGQEVFVASVNMFAGTTNWAWIENGPGDNSGTAIDVDTAGKVFFTGFFGNSISFDTLNTPFIGNGQQDIFVAELDPATGHVQQIQVNGDIQDEQPNGLACLGSGVYVAGFYESNLNFPPLPISNDDNSQNVFVGKLFPSPACDASFNYLQDSFCLNDPNPLPTLTGDPGGTFSEGTGFLPLNPLTGEIDLSLSPAPGTYTITYRAPLGCSISVTLHLVSPPTPADAGPDQTGAALCGASSTLLNGNPPSIGTGTWRILSGTGGSIPFPNDPFSPFSGTIGVTYELEWRIDNQLCTSADSVVITFSSNPTVAAAGPDQGAPALCGLSSTILNANTPTNGTGTWTSTPAAGTSFGNITQPNSTFSGAPGGTYTLTWAIDNGTCPTSTDEVVITFPLNPSPANAGPGITAACGQSTFPLNATPPTSGTGTWSIMPTSGPGGSFMAPNSPTSDFTGQPGQTYYLQWTVSTGNSCPDSMDSLTVFIPVGPSTADAGPDHTGLMMCGLFSTTLNALPPTSGNGVWTIESGGGGTISNLSNPSSPFSGMPDSTYLLRWTVSLAPCSDSWDTVRISFPAAPTPAIAGVDQDLCATTTTTLQANSPIYGTGMWTSLSGGTFGNTSNPASTFSGVAGNAYTLVWTISNAPCPATTDTVVLRFRQPPTAASAGPDQTDSTLCGLTSTTLTANTPVNGTGTWTVISSLPGNFTNPNSPTSGFTGQPGQSYLLRWTISNAPCPDSRDDVLINFPLRPDSAQAGPDLTGPAQCGLTSLNLQANSPLSGTGAWSLLNGVGSGNIADRFDPNSVFSGQPGTAYSLVWTISSGGVCPDQSDTVLVNFHAHPTPAQAGPDQTGPDLCGQSSTLLAGNTPSFGQGQWSILSGAGGSFSNAGQAQALFSGQPGTTYNLLWITRNAPCPADTDTVLVAFPPALTGISAGPDQQVCGSEATLNGTGTPGVWTRISGNGTVTNPAQPGAQVTGLSAGLNVFQWTVTQGPCSDSGQVNITAFAPVTAPTLSGDSICNQQYTLNAPPVVNGYGFWRSVSGNLQFDDPFLNTATVSDLVGGSNLLDWVVVNGPCRDSTRIALDFLDLDPAAGPDLTLCLGDTVGLGADPGQNGYWEYPPFIFVEDMNVPDSRVSSPAGGISELIWHTVSGNCDQSDTLALETRLPPTVVNAGPDQTLNLPASATLNALPPDVGTGLWSPGTGNFSVNIVTPGSESTLVTNLLNGTNEFVWTVTHAPCAPVSDTMVITVETLVIPDAFSPNGDNVNDRFVVEGIENLSGTTFTVFNRWGNEVFANSNYQNNWAGTNQKGQPLADDTYYFVLEIPEQPPYKGFVILRRTQ